MSSIPIEPPVAWKNEPCGRWSRTVAPALVIAAAQTALTPAARTVCANEAEAIVAPAVVLAEAALIRIDETGAISAAPPSHPAIRLISRSFTADALMTPAIVPVPQSGTSSPARNSCTPACFSTCASPEPLQDRLPAEQWPGQWRCRKPVS